MAIRVRSNPTTGPGSFGAAPGATGAMGASPTLSTVVVIPTSARGALLNVTGYEGAFRAGTRGGYGADAYGAGDGGEDAATLTATNFGYLKTNEMHQLSITPGSVDTHLHLAAIGAVAGTYYITWLFG